jgi:hypothetical protein
MRRLLTLLTAVALVAGFQPVAVAEGRQLPSTLAGWTTDNGYATTRLVNTAKATSRMTTVRVVFDEWVKARDYVPTVKALYPHAYVMGELLDSYYVPQYSLSQYTARTKEYLDTLGPYVDIWEVGNEVNGEWLGSTSSVVAKVSAAYDLVKGRGLKTAVTAYYNPNCWERRSNDMWTWLPQLPERIRNGTDYLFISWYEQDCEGQRFSQAHWQGVFDRLHQMFPNSKLGFGELGADKGASFAVQRDYMTRYYSLKISTPGYVGFYGWWYGFQQLTPTTKPLFPVFDQLIQGL